MLSLDVPKSSQTLFSLYIVFLLPVSLSLRRFWHSFCVVILFTFTCDAHTPHKYTLTLEVSHRIKTHLLLLHDITDVIGLRYLRYILTLYKTLMILILSPFCVYFSTVLGQLLGHWLTCGFEQAGNRCDDNYFQCQSTGKKLICVDL